MNYKILSLAIVALLAVAPLGVAQVTKEKQAALTPDKVLSSLMAGNARFAAGRTTAQDITARRAATAKGQHPEAVVLSCLDSRVPVEMVFDKGIGDLFVGRVAGNVGDKDQLGSMEFATKLEGAKLVMVLGHTSCGAIKGACDGAKLGHLTGLLAKIRPAVRAVKDVPAGQRTSANAAFVNKVAKENVRETVANIRKRSPILADLEKSGQIKIVGALYDLATGKVLLVQ